MRTTVNLDQEAYELASLYSRGRGVTLGAALSELAKKGIEALREEPSQSPNLERLPNGMLVFKSRKDGRVITTGMVKAALEEYDD
jgi:hypothetical protein